MSERSGVPARPVRERGFWPGLLALLAPRRFAEPLARADHTAALQSPDPERPIDLDVVRETTLDHLHRVRRALLGSALSMGSAVLVAVLFRTTDIAPMLPRPVLAVGSIVCFAVATLARLGWRGPAPRGDTSVERFDQRLFHVLYWIGMCWAALAIL